VICDYIAGMTDPFIQRLHQELLGGPPFVPAPPRDRPGEMFGEDDSQL
jgi:hypothetical protein